MSELISNQTLRSVLEEYAQRGGYVLCDGVGCEEKGAMLLGGVQRCFIHHARSVFTVEEHAAMRRYADKFLHLSVGSVTSQLSVAAPDALRAAGVWHVVGKSVVLTGSRADLPSGFCYVLMVKWRYRDEIMSALGRSPTFLDLLKLSVSYIETTSRLASMVICDANGVTVPLRDALVHVAKSATCAWPVRSLGAAMSVGRYEPVVSCSLLPYDRLGAERVKPDLIKQYNPGEPDFGIMPKYEPPMSAAAAQQVMVTAMRAWGFYMVELDAVLEAIVPLLCFGTSAKIDYAATRFYCRGRVCTLKPLCAAATAQDPSGSPVRRWVKSFRSGALCCMMMSYLLENPTAQVAQLNAGRYNAYGRHVSIAFDCAHTLKHVYPPSFFFRRALRVIKSLRFRGTI